MQLINLLEKMKMEHLGYQFDTLCEQASKKDQGYREFLLDALQTEWNGRHLKGVEARQKIARVPWVKTIEQFDFTFQPSIDRKVIREFCGLGLYPFRYPFLSCVRSCVSAWRNEVSSSSRILCIADSITFRRPSSPCPVASCQIPNKSLSSTLRAICSSLSLVWSLSFIGVAFGSFYLFTEL